MFWRKKNKPSSIAWRDNSGKIVCPGDSCPQQCDGSCPIWLNTMGLKLLQIQKLDEAIKCFQSALLIAPDFSDVQNNLGTAFGMSNHHQEAYDAFCKALEMRHGNFPAALRGIIVAETNLGKYEDALKHCDEYDLCQGCDSSKLRENISKHHGPSKFSYMDVVKILLENGRNEGYIQSEDVPFIPELTALGDKVCIKILQAISKYHEEEDPNCDVTFLTFNWCAYAGIGAVYYWDQDWPQLSKTGVFETLTKERGVFEMDEYVLERIGIPSGTDEEDNLREFLSGQSQKCISMIVGKPTEQVLEAIPACAKAMYILGMIFEMNRLGME